MEYFLLWVSSGVKGRTLTSMTASTRSVKVCGYSRSRSSSLFMFTLSRRRVVRRRHATTEQKGKGLILRRFFFSKKTLKVRRKSYVNGSLTLPGPPHLGVKFIVLNINSTEKLSTLRASVKNLKNLTQRVVVDLKRISNRRERGEFFLTDVDFRV